MEHVVFFTAADGSPAYRRTANLDDAVRVVEHLRNAEGCEEVHVYSLASVALNFRPYYRVELNANPTIPAQPDSSAAPLTTAPVAMAPVAAQLPHPVASELAEFAAEPVGAQSFEAQPVAAQSVEPAAAPVHQEAAPVQYAEPAAAAPEPLGQFMPMPPAAQPMPAEPMPAMAAAAPTGEQDDAEQNGRGRSLGFFTR